MVTLNNTKLTNNLVDSNELVITYICTLLSQQELQVDLTTPSLEEEVITSVFVKILYSEKIEQDRGPTVLMCMEQSMRILLLKDYMTMTYLVLSAKPHEDPC